MKRISTYILLVLSLVFLGTLPMAADSKAEQWSYPSSNPELSSFSGSGTASSPYLIQSAQDLANLAYIVTDDNDDVTGKYFKMTRDIYLNDFTVDASGEITANGDLKEWTPIGEHGVFRDDDFQGIFDGDGHTIYGLYMKTQAKRYYVGLFGSTEDAIIKNLTIKNAYICLEQVNCSHHVVGTLVGRAATSTFTNVGVEGSYIYCNFNVSDKENFDCGGLLGSGECDMTLTDCSFDGNIKLGVGNYVHGGGLLGRYCMAGSFTYQTLRLTRCQTKGSLTADCLTGAYVYIGGFVGYMSESIEVYVTECLNRLNLTANNGKNNSFMTQMYAYNMVPYVTEMRRSANLGNISFTGELIELSGMYLNGKCTDGYYDCVNYGKYLLPAWSSYTKITINPGKNRVKHNGKQNLIVWKEAKPELGENDTYVSDGDEMTAKELQDEPHLVYTLNHEVGENVWGTCSINEGSVVYQLPMPIACGGVSSELYQNDNGAYLISSEADLRTLQGQIQKGINAEASYLLTTDLDLTGHDALEQIGDANHPFKGTFDGGGHVISGITVNGRALFGNLSGTVANLALVGMTFTGDNATCAPFAYKAGASDAACIENCYAGGTITLADNTNNATTLAGLCYEAADHSVSIKNCYFRGVMANTTNVEKQQHNYYGLVGHNGVASSLTMSNCYAAFEFADEEATGAGIMPDASATAASLSNCRYLCSQLAGGAGEVKSNGALAACFKDVEGWLTGAYRPVLSSVRHYALTTPDAQTVYADAIAMDDDSLRNDIFCHTLTAETASDALLWALPNVALCNSETKVNYLLNCHLHEEAPFRFTPPAESVTKGQMHFSLSLSDPQVFKMMCLPATLHKSSLPEGSRLFVMGKAIGSADEGYSAYTMECDSVPAGVPFMLYVNNKNEVQTADVLLRGDIVSQPQTAAEQDGQTFEVGPTGTFEAVHVEKGCAAIEAGFDVCVTYDADGFDVKPFGAWFDCDATVVCDGGVMLDEMSNHISEVISRYKDLQKVAVFFKRQLHKEGWNTLCAPFSMSQEEIASKYGYGTKIEQLSSISTDDAGVCTLHFEQANSIEAGHCYLVKPEKDDLSWIQLENKTLCDKPVDTEVTSTDGSFTVSFKGAFERTVLDGSDTGKGTYFTQNNTIYKVANGSTILMNGFRCWIETSKDNAIKQAKMAHFDGTTDDVRIVELGTTGSTRIYDLQGIETQRPQAGGVYIQGGHKFIKR